jgi:membrane protein YdbS with pleckstrin-like domain
MAYLIVTDFWGTQKAFYEPPTFMQAPPAIHAGWICHAERLRFLTIIGTMVMRWVAHLVFDYTVTAVTLITVASIITLIIHPEFIHELYQWIKKKALSVRSRRP